MSGDVAYIDTSSFLKLVLAERESSATAEFLRPWPHWASSLLLRVEAMRAAAAADGAARAAVAKRLRAVHLISLSEDVVELAILIGAPGLRTLDALHLASAMTLGDELGALVTHDRRLLAAAAALGLPAVSPG